MWDKLCMATTPIAKQHFWRRAQQVLRVVVALNLAVLVWAIGFRGESGPPAVLPDIELAEDAEFVEAGLAEDRGAAEDVAFSLDLDIVATVDHELIYAVEQRARPAYRIFSLDPSTGEVDTVFTVPDDAIIYGIALSPDRGTLAVGYTPDFTLEGNGIWTLDLASGTFDEQVEVTRGVHLVDLSWAADGESLLATEVDRRGEETLAAVAIDTATNTIATRVDNAISPVDVAGEIHYLVVDEDKARRSIGVLGADGTSGVIDIADAALDLDHLTASTGSEVLRVAVLDLDDGGVTLGATADAHGSHDVPSSWVEISTEDHDDVHAAGFEPVIVYDAAATPDTIVYATKEGLSIATDSRIDVIASRAIRFVAA